MKKSRFFKNFKSAARQFKILRLSIICFIDYAASQNVWRFAFAAVLAAFSYFSYCFMAQSDMVRFFNERNLQIESVRADVEQIKTVNERVEKAVRSTLAFDVHFKQSFLAEGKRPVASDALRESTSLIKAAQFEAKSAAATIEGSNYSKRAP